jgi:hypothetical protein
VQLLGLLLKLLKAALGVNVDGVFGVVANVEALFERLRRASDALADALETHLVKRVPPRLTPCLDYTLCLQGIGCDEKMRVATTVRRWRWLKPKAVLDPGWRGRLALGISGTICSASKIQ